METLVKVDHLEQIFQECLNHFCYKTDMEVFHKVDYWVGPDEIQADLKKFGMHIGDCDDFASMCVVRCRKVRLLARFVYCITETKESHLVCEVNGWILDNRFPRVMRRDDLKYSWIAVSGFNKGDQWELVE